MKKIKRFFFLILVIVLAVCGFQIKRGYDRCELALSAEPLEEKIAQLKAKEHYTRYEDVPEIYWKAVVAVEDRRFYLHRGFDPLGTARALYRDLREKKLLEGGSTISQQLAKNLYFPMDSTLERKIAEVFLAKKLESVYNKEEILEFYANAIYFGSGYYCIYDAAKGYFKKEPAAMNADECTLLAGIPNAPSVYSPDVNPELARKRQDKVLSSMMDAHYLTEEEAAAIRSN